MDSSAICRQLSGWKKKIKNLPQELKIVQFIVLAGYVTWLNIAPLSFGDIEFFWDDLAHASCWLILCLSLRLALPRRKFIYPAVWLFAYSVLVEVVQHFLPYREFSMLDILANGVGVLLALACIRLMKYAD